MFYKTKAYLILCFDVKINCNAIQLGDDIMKKATALLLSVIMVLSALPVMSVPSFAEDETVYEVSTWEELDAAFRIANYDGAEYTVKLMNNLYFSAIDTARTATYVKMTEIFGGIVTFDFNGHTLSCSDTVSETDLDYCLSDFLRIDMHQIDADTGSVLRFTDSVGGGGISMVSKRGKDSQLAALHVAHNKWYKKFGYLQSSSKCDNVVIFDGGTYTLTASCTKFGRGTLNRENAYRGTVIVDEVQATVNGGTFIAQGDGTGVDECYRELSALASACSITNPSGIFSSTKMDFIPNCYAGSLVINGGLFQSVGYSVHHFDKGNSSGYSGPTVNSTGCMLFPKIYGGTFVGRMGFVGMTFTYNDGYSDFREKAASDIIKVSANTVVKGKTQSNSNINGLDGLTLGDLHNVKTLYIVSEDFLNFRTKPVADSFPATLERDTLQSDTFEALYDIPSYMSGMPVSTEITITPVGGNTVTVNSDSYTVNYANYPDGLTVNIKTTFTLGGENTVAERTYVIDVTEAPQAADIISNPTSVTVEPGEWAQATVIADHATAYNWQYNMGGTWVNLSDYAPLLSGNGTEIEGYSTPTLRVKINAISSERFRCRVTGTDGTVKTVPNSSGIYFDFGKKPTVSSFEGGEYLSGGDAAFTLKAKYLDASNADTVKWYIADRSGGSLAIRTVDEFCADEGLTYDKITQPKLNRAIIVFHGVTSAKVYKCSLCYELTNTIGTVDVNVDDAIGCLPFTLTVIKPTITSGLENKTCIEGQTLVFSFSADNMNNGNWEFERDDGDGNIDYFSVDDMEALFPECTFTQSFTNGDTATLTVTNARTGLMDYVLHGYAEGVNGTTSAGFSLVSVREAFSDEIYGDITSLWLDTDEILVQLIPEGYTEAAYETSATGNFASYSFTGVSSGTYTLRVIKRYHLVYETQVTLANVGKIVNVELTAKGDFDADGYFDLDDYAFIRNYIEGTGTLDGNQMLLADLQSDTAVDAFDLFILDKGINNLI